MNLEKVLALDSWFPLIELAWALKTNDSQHSEADVAAVFDNYGFPQKTKYAAMLLAINSAEHYPSLRQQVDMVMRAKDVVKGVWRYMENRSGLLGSRTLNGSDYELNGNFTYKSVDVYSFSCSYFKQDRAGFQQLEASSGGRPREDSGIYFPEGSGEEFVLHLISEASGLVADVGFSPRGSDSAVINHNVHKRIAFRA